MKDWICENCGFKESEMDQPTPVQCYRSEDANGEIIETLCGFCVAVEVAAGIPHELIPEEA